MKKKPSNKTRSIKFLMRARFGNLFSGFYAIIREGEFSCDRRTFVNYFPISRGHATFLSYSAISFISTLQQNIRRAV
jgi:hypothetical protein